MINPMSEVDMQMLSALIKKNGAGAILESIAIEYDMEANSIAADMGENFRSGLPRRMRNEATKIRTLVNELAVNL